MVGDASRALWRSAASTVAWMPPQMLSKCERSTSVGSPGSPLVSTGLPEVEPRPEALQGCKVLEEPYARLLVHLFGALS